MKEIEKLIEATQNLNDLFTCCDKEERGLINVDRISREADKAIIAAESMLKRAKVYEGWTLKSATNQPFIHDKHLKSVIGAFTDRRFSDEQIKIRIIVIPTEENNEGK